MHLALLGTAPRTTMDILFSFRQDPYRASSVWGINLNIYIYMAMSQFVALYPQANGGLSLLTGPGGGPPPDRVGAGDC